MDLSWLLVVLTLVIPLSLLWFARSARGSMRRALGLLGEMRVQTARIGELVVEVTGLRAENAKLKQERAALEVQISDLVDGSAMEDLRTEIAATRAENASQADRIRVLEGERESLVRGTKAIATSSEREINRLKSELAHERSRVVEAISERGDG